MTDLLSGVALLAPTGMEPQGKAISCLCCNTPVPASDAFNGLGNQQFCSQACAHHHHAQTTR